MRAMAGTAVAAGVFILILVVAATMLSVTFATRGAMATNKPVIEVLHFVGAKNGFIAGHFQRHFLMLGCKAARSAAASRSLLFALAGVFSRWFAGTAGGRTDVGTVRLVRDRDRRLCGRAGADRADRGGHRADLAPHGQPHAGGDRLMLAGLARWIGFLTMRPSRRALVLLVCGFFWFVPADPDRRGAARPQGRRHRGADRRRRAHPRRDRIAGGRARQAPADQRRLPHHPRHAR